MSRSNYAEREADWQGICWRGAVKKAIKGKRGQAFLREMLVALDALPDKRLIDADLEQDGAVCAIGAVGRARGLDMSEVDPEDSYTVARLFGISNALAREIAYINDDEGEAYYWRETPEQRYVRVRAWIEQRVSFP